MPSESLRTQSKSVETPLGGPGWSIGSLLKPAYVRVGTGWLAASHRLWLDWITETIEDTLRAELGVQPTITPTRTRLDSAGALPAAFSVTMTFAAMGTSGRCVITLRPDAARAIADAILIESTGLRGHAAPTPTELGILEFVALTLADVLSRRLGEHLGPSAPTIAITAFSSGAEAAAALASIPAPPISLAISLAGRHGEILAAYDGWTASPVQVAPASPPATGSPTPRDDGPGHVTVGLALAPVALSPQELQVAAAGDVLMLGCSELGLQTPCAALVTATGWRLCEAMIVKDSPTTICVRCERLAPIPLAGWTCADQSPTMVPVVGRARLSSLALQDWMNGRTQDLAPVPGGGVQLWMNAKPWALGELARVGDEAGVRIVRFVLAGEEFP